jgi:hypothetical protein
VQNAAVRLIVLLLLAVAALAACGSSSKPNAASSTTTAPTTTTVASSPPPLYCERAKEYLAATNVDTSSAQSTIDGFTKAAQAARRVVDVAPVEVRSEHDRLASGAEELVAGIQARAPKTQTELETVGKSVTESLKTRYGDLEQETQAVQAYLSRACGIAAR